MLLDDQKEQSLAWNHLTEAELRRLHRRFGHPSVQRLHKVLQQSGHPVEIAALEQLTKICRRCQMHAPAPARFKFTLHDDCSFNFEIIVDVVYLDGNHPALHVVDTATSFNAACFLPGITAKSTWEALRSAEFRQLAKTMAISIKEVPIEAHHSVGKVERYHALLRRACEIFRAEDPNANPELALQMAVKALNDTAGPKGLVPTLLVFGAYPRMTDDSAPSPDLTRRAEALRKATDEVRRTHATRQVAEGLAARNGPDTASTLDLPLQSDVRVWHKKQGWQGPFKLIATNGESCTIVLPRGSRTFRLIVVKPFLEDTGEGTAEGPAPPPSEEERHIEPAQ